MTSECNSCKRPFDITKSKRTRKSSFVTEAGDEDNSTIGTPEGSEKTNGHAKLKQFIKVDGLGKEKFSDQDQRRAVLSKHFEDDKQLQLVIKQPEGVKFKGIVKRYVKALSHLVKSKHGRRLEKPVLRLTM